MREQAVEYIKLALSLGRHDTDYVDAYYGPEELRKQADEDQWSLPEIRDRALAAASELPGEDERAVGLGRQLRSLASRADLVGGSRMAFDEESEALYGEVAPRHSEDHFAAMVSDLDGLLPGSGDVSARYREFAAGYAVPRTRLESTLEAAIAECRTRTAARIPLPDGEAFGLEYVTGYSWAAQNWYQGEYRSRILINLDVPLRIDRMLDLAGHEGYPGHHVAGLTMQRDLVEDRGWLEFTVFPLYSPVALTLEGTAMLAPEVAFPGAERLAFERDVLYPLAGLDPAGAERYDRVRRLADRLGYAVNEAARDYLDGRIGADEAVDWLVRYALMTPEQARIRLTFIEQYRSYVINYNVGLDAVRRVAEARGGTAQDPDRLWSVFHDLLKSPSTALA